jgi:hypothetical protein
MTPTFSQLAVFVFLWRSYHICEMTLCHRRKAQIKLPTVASPWRIVHVIKSWQHLLPTVQAIKGRMNHSFFLEEKSSLWFSILSNPAAFISNLQPYLQRREFSCHWNINIYYSQNNQTELAIKCMDFIQTFSLNLKIHTQIYHL